MNRRFLPLAASSLVCLAAFSFPVRATEPTAPEPAPVKSLIDAEEFLEISRQAAKYRDDRQVSLNRFLHLASQEGTLILDTRSKAAFDRRHLQGAVHLNFSDITDEKLAEVIPEKLTLVLIYCNNNFAGDPANFATKRPALALNVPTFINLYASGYWNLYELGELLSVDDPRLEFEGTAVDGQRTTR